MTDDLWVSGSDSNGATGISFVTKLSVTVSLPQSLGLRSGAPTFQMHPNASSSQPQTSMDHQSKERERGRDESSSDGDGEPKNGD